MPDDIPNPSRHTSRLDSVLAEIEQAREQGQAIDVRHYLDSYPDLDEPLRNYFRDYEWFARVAPTATYPGAPLPQPGLPPGSRFAGYKIIKELGRGGMGIVYHARQLSPKREVALKVIRTDRLQDLPLPAAQKWTKRFRHEAQLVASLEQHSNIVTLYEVGECDGQSFFTMQLVRGANLAQSLAAGRWSVSRGSILRSATIVMTVARAIGYAHQRGILHRDLKPANILLDEEENPLVSDFGLARRLDESGSMMAGAIEGTAAYMSPEQARSEPVAPTTATDVYGLGAVLYELLTGRPPFKGKNDIETLLQVTAQEPPAPRSLNPHLPRDLEVICLKCLEKEPTRRYTSAAELADDLDNWLQRRPIIARPISSAGRAWRLCQRNPLAATLASAVLLSIVVGAAASSWFGVRSSADAKAARRAQGDAEEAARVAKQQTTLAQLNEAEALRKEKLQRRRYYFAQMALTQRAMDNFLVAPALKLLEESKPGPGQEDIRGFEWHYFDRQCHQESLTIRGHAGGVWSVRYSPDGARLITGGDDGTVRVWDSSTGHELQKLIGPGGPVVNVAYSPDGKQIASGGFDNQAIRVWDSASFAEQWTAAAGGHGLAFSPDGKLLATHRSEGIVFLNASNGMQTGRIPDAGIYRVCLAYSHDGKLLASGGRDPATRKFAVKIWDVGRSKLIHICEGHSDGVQCVAFAPDDKTLASGSRDGTMRFWDVATGKETDAIAGPKGDIYDIAFSPCFMFLGNGMGFSKGMLIARCHFNFPDADDFPRIVSLHVRGWERQPQPLLGHTGTISSLSFRPQGGQIATASMDGSVKIWQLSEVRDATVLVRFGGSESGLVISRDGCIVARGHSTAVDSTAVHVRKLLFSNGSVESRSSSEAIRNTQRMPPILHTSEPTRCLAMSASGGVLAITTSTAANTNSAPSAIAVWDLSNSTLRKTIPADARYLMPGAAPPLALDERGTRLALVGPDDSVQVRDTSTGQIICSLPKQLGGIHSLALDPNGGQLACCQNDGTIGLWDLGTAKLRHRFSCALGNARLVVFDPDGKRLAALENSADQRQPTGGLIQIWDAASGKQVVLLRGHNSWVRCAAFHPDGRRLVSGSDDRSAKIWDLETGQECVTLGRHAGGVHAVAFTADGFGLVTIEGPIPNSRMGGPVFKWGEPSQMRVEVYEARIWNAEPRVKATQRQSEKPLSP
jgi:WD40 repeat protein/serine/threonine protein kinase